MLFERELRFDASLAAPCSCPIRLRLLPAAAGNRVIQFFAAGGRFFGVPSPAVNASSLLRSSCMPVVSLGRSSDYAVNRHSVWVSDLFILFFRTKVETLNRLKK